MKRNVPSSTLWRHSLLLLLSMVFMVDSEEDKAIYLVLAEGQPAALRREVDTPLKQNNKGDKTRMEREWQQEHAKKLTEFHDQLLQKTLDAGSYNKLYSFHHIINGFAVHTTESQAMRLRSAAGVHHVERDRGVKLMTTYTPHLLSLPERVWPQVGGGREHAGEGIVIGVIDTGIDPAHPSFAYDDLNKSTGGFWGSACTVAPQFPAESCNGKIVTAKYFAAGAAAALPLDASRDLSPYDETGHGSHVASVAAGNWGVPVVVNGFNYGWASGMAPRARIAVYKAVYPEGGTLADVVSAVDQAIQDGVDVLVLSIGPDEPPEDTLTFMSLFDISLLFARKAGVFVVQAAGNKGPGEATVVSYSPWAMGVAASTTGRRYTPSLVLGDGKQIHGVGLTASTAGNGLLQFRLVSARDAAVLSAGSIFAEECQRPEALQPTAVLGSILVCSFSQGFLNGSSTVIAILNTAQRLGFAGFILVANPLYGDFIAQPLPFTVPGIMIPRIADAQILWNYYEKHTSRDGRGAALRYGGSAAIKEGRVASFNETEFPTVARFSSRGPDIIDNKQNPADILKPDILAPGDQILAAWSPTSLLDPILAGNHFALISGTSMAAPHVAGIAALIKQAHPSWTPSMIASALSTTATRHDSRGSPVMAQGAQLYSLYPSTPFDSGAGLVNPSAALDPGLILSSDFEDYIRFLCSLPALDPTRVHSITGMQCNVTLASPTDLNLPSITVSTLVGSRLVRRTVMNVGTEPEEYSCSVLLPEGVTVDIQPSWFRILPQGKQDLVIKLNASHTLENFSFGEIVLTGNLDHIVRLPLSVFPVAM